MIVALAIRMPKGPAHYWAAAKDFGEAGFTVWDLWKRTNGVSRAAIRNWVAAMVERGGLREAGSRNGRVLYACARERMPDNGEARHGEVQRHLWTAIRALPQFTLTELAAAASTDTVAVSRNAAQLYVGRLARAGALTVVRAPQRNSLDSGVWRLKRSCDFGPVAPQWVKAAFLYDPNANAAIGEAEALP